MALGRLLSNGLVVLAFSFLLTACTDNKPTQADSAPIDKKASTAKTSLEQPKAAPVIKAVPVGKHAADPAVDKSDSLANKPANVIESDVVNVSTLAPKISTAAQNENSTLVESNQQPAEVDKTPLTILDISERSYDGGNAIAVTLSTALDTSKSYDDYFVLSSKKQGVVEGKSVLSENGKIVYFPFVEPNSHYKVIVYKYLPAVNGSALTADTMVEVTTRNIQPSYSFVSKGAFLPLNQHTGIPVTTVNTPEVNVDYFKVGSDKVAAFLSRNAKFKDSVGRYSARRSLSYGQLVYSARYQFDAPKNKRREFNLPVQSIEALDSPGIYVAVISRPGDYYNNVRMTHFTVTDIGIHVRAYKSQFELLLNSLTTQQPLAGVKIQLVDHKGHTLYVTKSSPAGMASIPNEYPSAKYLVARDGPSLSIVPLSGPAIDLSEFDLAKRLYQPQELFVYSARDLYRPGEVIDFNALIRDQDGRAVKAPTLKAIIRQPGGNVAKQFKWRSDSHGYYQQSYQVPQGAKTGLWKLEIKNANAGLVTYPFKVEEFLPERLKITFNKGQVDSYKQVNDKLTVAVLGEYLYGAPASKNRFESRISLKPARQPFKHLAGFEFGNSKEQRLVQNYKLSDVKLNAQGQANITVKNRWRGAKSPVTVSLLGSLFESGGRPVTRKHQQIVLPKGPLIGIKPHFTGNPSRNSRVMFDVITTNQLGEQVAITDLKMRLIREDRRYFWEFSNSRGWHYQWSDKEYVESNEAISTSLNDATLVELAVEYGGYRLEVEDPSSGLVSSVRFHAGRDWYRAWKNNQSGSQAAKPDKVSLAWDKEAYQAGDQAKLSIVPPKAGEAILLIEADSPLLMKRITIPKEGVVVTIPVDRSWQRHDIYASVIHLQHGDKGQHITPTRALGLLHLPLDRTSRKLEVNLDVADKIYPNQRYSAHVQVQGAQNQQAKLTLAMVDVGVLSLTNYKTPEPHQYFFEPRRFEIDSRDMYQKLIELNDNALAKQKFGGDAQLSRGGKKAQSDVQILSLFSGLVDVDEQGIAQVDFDIPDFNGRVRLMAVAFTDDKFGSAETEMTIAAPIVTQLAMPRFVAIGDQSTLALDVHNLTEETQQLTINLSATEAITFSDQQSVQLAANEKTTLLYPINVKALFGHSAINLNLTGVEDFSVNRSWGLTSRSAYPMITETKRAVLSEDDSFSFSADDTQGLLPSTIEAVLTVNNTVDLDTRGQLKNLLRYPYGCLEQTTSSSYPWLYADSGTIAELHNKYGQKKSKTESLQQGIERLQAKVLPSGGFGLWSNTSPEEHWLTAYVGDFLTDARSMGVNVPDRLFNKTMTRLRDYLKQKNGRYNNRWSQSSEHYDFAYRAYAGYVLSRHKKASLSNLRELAKHKASDAKSALPLVHLGLALINQGDHKRGKVLLAQAKSKTRSSKYLGDYGSNIRDMALTIAMILKQADDIGSGYGHDYAHELTFKLADLLKQRRYLSTQERNAVFMAGTLLAQNNNQQWQADLALNGAINTIENVGAFTKVLAIDDLTTPLTLTNTESESLFVNLSYQGVSEKAPEPVADNIAIERSYYDTQGKTLDPSKLTVGDLVLVKLKVSSESRKPDLMVVDLLPAGLELENQNLAHSIKLDEIKIEQKKVSNWYKQTRIVHQEFRDDRYVAAIDIGYSRSSYLFYLARAVTPGVYKVPPPFAEDMYRPEDYALGETLKHIEIVNP